MQAYALVTSLNGIKGVKAQCLAFDPADASVPGVWEKACIRYANVPNRSLAFCKSVCYALRYRITHRKKVHKQADKSRPKVLSGRALRFREFASQFQDRSIIYRKAKALNNAPVDCIVVGSDWVWHLGQPSVFFADPVIQKPFLSYAASFGILPQSEEELTKVRAFAPRFRHLSCRELEGAKLLQQLGFVGARQDIDPTLLLTRQEWDKAAQSPKERDVLVVYWLPNDDEERVVAYVNTWRKAHPDVPVVVINPNPIALEGATVRSDIGPQDFLGYIRDAKYVITNSFHACVFCSVWHKPFSVFPRFQRDTRIQNFLHLTGLTDRMVECRRGETPIWDREIDWGHADQAVRNKAEESIASLRRLITENAFDLGARHERKGIWPFC